MSRDEEERDAAQITSPSNPRIKRLVGLRNREARDRESVFVVEGARDLGRALESGHRPTEVYYDNSLFSRSPFPAPDEASVDALALDRASYRGHSQGIIAVFEQFDVNLDRLELGPAPLVLVLEAIEKPGNLGAMLRTADAVGVDAVIALGAGIDPFNPNVIRASTGTLFTVPLAVTDLETAAIWLEQRDVRIVAADPLASTTLWEADLSGPTALLIGSEHDGLTPSARSAAGLLVSIPMHGAADSLNASVSAAILAFEALRQRSC